MNLTNCHFPKKHEKFTPPLCKIIVRCGENVGKILYKNGLQVSVGHLRVPGAGIEPARIAPLVFETSASTDSAIRAGVLFCSLLPGLKEAREGLSFN